MFIDILKSAAKDWVDDEAARLGAALSYYAAFSIVPLSSLIIGIAGMVFRNDTEKEILKNTSMLLGSNATDAIENLLSNSGQSNGSLTILGIVALLFSASGVFGELQTSFNKIWDVEPKPTAGILDFIKGRFFSILMVLGTAFLLIVSLTLSSGLAILQTSLFSSTPQSIFITFANTMMSLLILSLIFTLMFKYLPDRAVDWSSVWPGGIFTAILFELGKYGLGAYLGYSKLGETFGAASSICILLIWVYYSSQILFFGAELTQAYSQYKESANIMTKK